MNNKTEVGDRGVTVRRIKILETLGVLGETETHQAIAEVIRMGNGSEMIDIGVYRKEGFKRVGGVRLYYDQAARLLGILESLIGDD